MEATSGQAPALPSGDPTPQFLELSAYECHNPLFSHPPHADTSGPPSGVRIPFVASQGLSSLSNLGPPVAVAKDGHSPVYLGSAFFHDAVHPCMVAPHLTPPCRVSWGHREHAHPGRFDVLPFDESAMEWVPASGSRLPPGRRPVEGGYEAGGKLYHVLAKANGVDVPGKVGEHLHCAGIPYAGREVGAMNYKILCWRE